MKTAVIQAISAFAFALSCSLTVTGQVRLDRVPVLAPELNAWRGISLDLGGSSTPSQFERTGLIDTVQLYDSGKAGNVDQAGCEANALLNYPIELGESRREQWLRSSRASCAGQVSVPGVPENFRGAAYESLEVRSWGTTNLGSTALSVSAPAKKKSVQPLAVLPPDSCLFPASIDFLKACSVSPLISFEEWRERLGFYAIQPVKPAQAQKQRFQWAPALWQSFEFLLVEHAFRLASDEEARYLLFHKPFWHDYWASADNFHMSRWGDGDSFIVNYIGHPMEGAVSGDIFLNNDPRGRAARFGKSAAYWNSRLKAMGWAAAYSAYFEIGPVLSEAAIGNEGGYTYVPGCGFYPCTKYPGKQFKPPTNNTGWVDFVMTPTLGMGWIVLEDAIETEIVDRLANGSPAMKYKVLRGALAPSRTLANVLGGKSPWFRYPNAESSSASYGFGLQPVVEQPLWKSEPRFGASVQFISMNLPLDREGCNNCGQFYPGLGFDFSYRFAKYAYVDSVLNLLPGSGGNGEHGGAQEALVGLKIGRTGRTWGVFSNLRGGTIHYNKALVPGSSTDYESTYRFALDLGGTVEYYASRNSTLRFNLGTTLVHYLTGYPDPNQPPTSVLSDQYYTLKGSPYLASGYVFRF